jgi:hypothetical protein
MLMILIFAYSIFGFSASPVFNYGKWSVAEAFLGLVLFGNKPPFSVCNGYGKAT